MRSELAILEILDRLKVGAALVDTAGAILGHNATYESSLHDLGLLCHETLAQIEAATREGAKQNLRQGADWCRLVELPCGSQFVLQCLGEGREGAQADHAVLIVTSLDRHPTPERIVLRQIFKLSPAEAVVAELISKGRSVSEIAHRTNTTEHTVRAHLKHIFQKTGTSTQGSLAHKLRRCSVMTCGADVGWQAIQLRDKRGPLRPRELNREAEA